MKRRKLLVVLIAISSFFSFVVAHQINENMEASDIWWHSDVRWAGTPIYVSCQGYNNHFQRLCDSEARNAIAAVNQEIGGNILKYRPGAHENDGGINILLGIPEDDPLSNVAGSAELRWPRGGSYFYSCRVVTIEDVNINGLQIILRHEFGHCLNLKHDEEDPTSIMFPDADGMVYFEDIPRFTSEDLEALRELYL